VKEQDDHLGECRDPTEVVLKKKVPAAQKYMPKYEATVPRFFKKLKRYDKLFRSH